MQIKRKYKSLSELMDERMRRQWAAAEAQAYGWGGIQAVSKALNMSPNTVRKGLSEITNRLNNPDEKISPRLRREGGGRKSCSESDSKLIEALMNMVEPTTRGDPESPLRWTCLSTSKLAKELTREGHPVSPRTVGRLLVAEGYSLQSNRKTKVEPIPIEMINLNTSM